MKGPMNSLASCHLLGLSSLRPLPLSLEPQPQASPPSPCPANAAALCPQREPVCVEGWAHMPLNISGRGLASVSSLDRGSAMGYIVGNLVGLSLLPISDPSGCRVCNTLGGCLFAIAGVVGLCEGEMSMCGPRSLAGMGQVPAGAPGTVRVYTHPVVSQCPKKLNIK